MEVAGAGVAPREKAATQETENQNWADGCGLRSAWESLSLGNRKSEMELTVAAWLRDGNLALTW
jgi:hypothetical protein